MRVRQFFHPGIWNGKKKEKERAERKEKYVVTGNQLVMRCVSWPRIKP